MSGESAATAAVPAGLRATVAGRTLGRHSGPLDPRAVPCSETGVKQIRNAATMGPGSGEELVSTSKWLKAHEREPQLPQPTKPAAKERRKAPIPARDERPLMGLTSSRDWVHTNVAEAAQAVPKYQEHEEVRYVFKPHFGELPPYLRQRKKELQAQREAAERAKLPVQAEEAGVVVISGDELADLIRHLKLKWQSINEAYVRLPCVLDTPSKKRRKEEMETQLAEIERDVRMLSKASSVRVCSG